MKLKYIFASLVAAAALFASCTQENPLELSNIKVSSSYVTFKADGGKTEITLTANAEWAFETLNFISGKDTLKAQTPSWVTVSPASGAAGTTTITFEATAAKETRSESVVVRCGDQTKTINLLQQTEKQELAISTCKQVNAGVEGVTYKVRGAVTKITEFATYGNMYISDGTDEVYIYGTKYNGETRQGAITKLGIEVGDIITVVGPLAIYNGTYELKDVDVEEITKALLGLSTDEINVEKNDTIVSFKLAYKGNDLDVEPKADWLSLANIKVGKDSTEVFIHVAANEDDTRIGEVVVKSSIPSQTSEMKVTITQATGLSMYTLPYAETFEKGQGAWTIDVTTPKADGSAIWSAGSYGGVYYMKASVGKTAEPTKTMLVSPMISLKNVASPVLTFKHCGKYFGDQQMESTLWVSSDNGASWTQLLIPEHDNAYGWKESGDISLASLVGKEYFQIGFQYVSTAEKSGTWEIADIKVEDRAPVLKSIAELNNAAATAEASYEVTLTDAVVSYVNGGNAFIQDATGGIQLYMKDHGLTAGDSYSGKVSVKVKLYSMFAELTSIDVTSATRETKDVAPVVLTLANLKNDYLRYQNCLVKLENVTFATGADGSKKFSDTLSQGEVTIDSRTQVASIAYEKDKAYNVVVLPTRYNTTLQVGIWEAPVAAE